jgi:hypothetical protein
MIFKTGLKQVCQRLDRALVKRVDLTKCLGHRLRIAPRQRIAKALSRREITFIDGIGGHCGSRLRMALPAV